nr:Sec-independent protein translocase component tatA/E [Microheliella maris]
MNISIGQLLTLIIIAVLLYGNFPSIMNQIGLGLKKIKDNLKNTQNNNDKE